VTARILDGRALSEGIEHGLRAEIASLANRGIRPGLVAIRVGEDAASEIYVRNKARKAEELGLRGLERHFDDSLSQDDLLGEIRGLNADDEVDAILVQLPLPSRIDPRRVIEAIAVEKDVDGFHPVNVGKLHLGRATFVPCTPAGIMKLIESTGIPVRGKRAVVVGRSDIVGKPAAALLLARDATVTICHSRTAELAAITREADILVAAVGRPHMIRGDMIKPGAIVIDVGINRLERSEASVELLARSPAKRKLLAEKGSIIVGDVELSTAAEVASWITPVPGGVGPMTITMLMQNTVTACKERRG